MREKRLAIWEEAVGVLNDVDVQDGIILVNLSIGKIAIPLQKLIFKKLNKMVGKKIAILRTDVKGKEYLLREVS